MQPMHFPTMKNLLSAANSPEHDRHDELTLSAMEIKAKGRIL